MGWIGLALAIAGIATAVVSEGNGSTAMARTGFGLIVAGAAVLIFAIIQVTS